MKKALVLMVLGMLVSVTGWGQNAFMKLYDYDPDYNIFHEAAILQNGNIVCVGRSDISPDPTKSSIVIYSPTGQKLHEWHNGATSIREDAFAVTSTMDGGFAVAAAGGYYLDSTKYFKIYRFSAQADSLWSWRFDWNATSDTIPISIYDIIEAPNGSFVIATRVSFANNYDLYVMKVDSQGNTEWTYRWGGSMYEMAYEIIPTSDGKYLISGASNSFNADPYYYEPLAIKIDTNGNEEWVKRYQLNLGSYKPVKVVENNIGNYVLVSTVHNPGYYGVMLEINSMGDSLRSLNTFGNIGEELLDIDYSITGDYLLTGWAPPDTLSRKDLLLVKIDEHFDLVWNRHFVDANAIPHGETVLCTQDSGFLITGIWLNKGLMLKTDSYGNLPSSVVRGKLVSDMNSNCVIDSGETYLPRHIVQVEASSTYNAMTDNNGLYQIHVYDTGTAILKVYPTNPYWSTNPCHGTALSFNLPINDTLDINVFAYPQVLCPQLNVNIGTSFLRRCMQNIFMVHYCNNGTVLASNPYLEIDFGQYLYPDYASLPWTTSSGSFYRWNLDTLSIGQCGSFAIFATVDCDSTELGQTHCVSAHIYPDSICLPPDPAWDGSSVAVSGRCDAGDTLNFTIGNTGAGDMTSPSFFLIAEDNVMYQSGNFQFLSGQDTTIRFKGNGSTFTLVANQVEGHPGLSFPMVSIEGCGTNSQGTFSKGFVTQYPQDDQDGFVDILCLQNVGSYDPNDKRAEPKGLNNEGFITATQPLDYTIRFQNTGTDTAFTVVIRDTLSAHLDITTLQLNAASHPYTFQIIGSNVLEWTFANILLPDSNTNEPLSHGFVSFHIRQSDGNAPGTEITNRAGIYFDFNAPIITNTTLNTVTEDYKTLFTFVQSLESTLQLGIYPNPNNGTFNLDFAAKQNTSYEFVIYDLAGAKRFGQTLQGQAPYTLSPELPSGMYLYQLLENGQPVGMGKVVVSR